jgi:hypothetical protein
MDRIDLAAHVKDNTCTCVLIMWPLGSSLFLTPIYASPESSTQLGRSKMGYIYIYIYLKKVKTTCKTNETMCIQNKKRN